MANTRAGHGAAGPQTAALAIGGPGGSAGNLVESYNGSSWTAISNLNTPRGSFGSAGNSSLALAIGKAPSLTTVELWNGTSWAATTSMANGREAGGAGDVGGTDAFIAGGSPALAATEEWTGPGSPVTQTITTS